MASTLQRSFNRRIRTGSLAAVLLFAAKAFAIPFGLSYQAAASCNFNGCQSIAQDSGLVDAPYLQLPPFDLTAGFSTPNYNIEASTDVAGDVQPGFITALASARVFGAIGEGAGTASTSFIGVFEDTLIPEYTGLGTFSMYLNSFLGNSNNGIGDCGIAGQTGVTNAFEAQTGSLQNSVSIERAPCDSTLNTETLIFTLPVTAGQAVQLTGLLEVSATAYGDASVGDGYAFADASHTGEFFVQDIGGDGTFTSASGHDYAPQAESPVPESGTLPLSLLGVLTVTLACRFKQQMK